MPSIVRIVLYFIGALGCAQAWDYEGHRLVNQLALASLPTNYPAFVRLPAAAERIAFLAGEPDRWRNSPDLPLKHFNAPDHYLDIEDLALYGLQPETLSQFRYEFAGQLAAARAAKPKKFPEIDPDKNTDKTRELAGFLPWTITEYYGKLKSAFSYLKAYQDNGTPEEIANAQQNVIYLMGVMGHFVGDATQPLHTTKHFNGWVGNNPFAYVTNRTFHGWVDGGYLQKVGFKLADARPKLRPARTLWPGNYKGPRNEVFPVVMNFLMHQFKLVEPLYQMDKDGKLSGEGEHGRDGIAFFSEQLLKAGQMLGDLWYSAWQQAPPDNYLKGQLAKRKLLTDGKGKSP